MKNTPKYTYKRLEENDLVHVQYLFLKVFKNKLSLTYLKNKYDTSIFGMKYICTIAFDDKKPIAFYGAIPQGFRINNHSFFVAQGCDSITLPQYQKQGLHYNLALKAYEIMKEKKVKFVYSFLNENSYYSTKKLGWKAPIKMKRFHLNIPTLPISRITNKLGLQKLYIPLVDFFLNQYAVNHLSEIDTLNKKNGNNYSEGFFIYKNSFNKHYLLKLHQCFFWVKVKAILEVGFFVANSKSDFKNAIGQLKKLAFLMGCNEILFQVSTNSKMYEFLQEIANPKESWLVGYLPFEDSIDMNQLEFTYADLDTF